MAIAGVCAHFSPFLPPFLCVFCHRKHFPELLLSLYKALQHPVLCCRLLLCEAAELVGPSRDVLLLRMRRHTDTSECMRALERFHATDVAR